MNRRRVLLALGTVMMMAFGGLTTMRAQSTGKTHHVLFAVSSGDPADWQAVMAHTRNLINGVKPDPIEVEVVAFSAGIDMVKAGSPVAESIAALQKDGVKFVACENAMRFHHLELKDLLPGMVPVPSGIVEVVEKQEQGWIYIKGGH